MCGIAGVLDPRRARPEADTIGLLARMTATIEHRGPDAAGNWVDEESGVGFGHRRLSVLDLSEHGAQPMVSADGRYVLAYNGEVYDHRELAAELDRAGVRRRGHSDTELLVEAIARWGLRPTLERIDGMFAFALWDRQDRRLTLARDRMGEKPLFYGTLGSGEVVFASGLDPIRAHPAFDRPVDRDALALYFRHKYVPAPWSIFEGIQKLEPGCTVTVDERGRIGQAEPYWRWFEVVERGVTFTGDDREAIDELERLLERSVRRRMVADVPVGAFLSGGIDSSTVVAAAQRSSSGPVRTFTIGSTASGYDESSDARKVAAHLGTEHTELVVTDDDALAAVHRLGPAFDEPFGDSSALPTLLVSDLARRDVTVALSGDGGDELFWGYNRYLWVPTIWRRIAGMPAGVRRLGAATLRTVPPRAWDRVSSVLPPSRRPRMLGLKVSKVLGIADATSPEDVYHRLVSHWQDPERLVPGAGTPPTLHTDRRRWPVTSDIVEHMAALDTATYLPDDILAKVDRATMSVSLEGRIPLLDRSIVELAAGLPPAMKVRDGRSKWLLRELLARSIPPELFERPKSGFGVPIEEWLVGPLREWAEHHLRGGAVASFLDPAPVEAAWTEHLAGARDWSYELWDVVMFSVWSEQRAITA